MKPWEYRQLTASEVFDYATTRSRAKWDHDIQVAYINAQLSLYGTLFDGKKWPSVDKFLSNSKHRKEYSVQDWKALITAVEANWGTPLTAAEAKKARKENLRRARERNGISGR